MKRKQLYSCFIIESLSTIFNNVYALAYLMLSHVFAFVKKIFVLVSTEKKKLREMYSTASGDTRSSIIKYANAAKYIFIYIVFIFMHDTDISPLKALLWDFFPSNKLNAFHFLFLNIIKLLSSKDKQNICKNRKRKKVYENLHEKVN